MSRNRLPATYIKRVNKINLVLVRTLNGNSVAMTEVFHSMSELNSMQYLSSLQFEVATAQLNTRAFYTSVLNDRPDNIFVTQR